MTKTKRIEQLEQRVAELMGEVSKLRVDVGRINVAHEPTRIGHNEVWWPWTARSQTNVVTGLSSPPLNDST